MTIPLITRAMQFAINAHEGQLDDCGENYVWAHLQPVAQLVELVTRDADFAPDEEIVAAAWLHDVLEDTDTKEQELRENFGDRVADLVLECTHEGKKDTTGYYFPRLKSRDSILIKFADRLQNLSRMDSWDDKRKQQYLNKSKFWKSSPNEL